MSGRNRIRSCLVIIVFIITAYFLPLEKSFGLPSNQVKSFVFGKDSTTETIAIHLTRPFESHAFVLHSPERIVIDIAETFFPQVHIKKKTKAQIVTSVTIAQNQKDKVRIVLHIANKIPYQYKINRIPGPEGSTLKIAVSASTPKKSSKGADTENAEASDKIPADHMAKRQYEKEKPVTAEIKNTSSDSDESLFFFEDTPATEMFKGTDPEKPKSDLRLSGIVQIRTSMDTKKNEHIENHTHFKNRILIESRYKKSFKISVLSDYLYFGNDNETDDYDLDLHEAFFSHNNNFIDFSLGKKIVRWGKADQISPVDTINPTDAREFILPDYEETKQPVWMANLTLLFDTFTLEGIFIPFFEKSELDYFGTDWAVFPHLKKEISASPVPENIKNYFDRMAVDEQDPDNETEFGLRFTTTIKNWDMGISWHYTTEDIPHFKSFPVKNIRVDGSMNRKDMNTALETAVFTNEKIAVQFQRTHVLGYEFETTLSDFGVRGEAAWYENQSLLTSSLTSSTHPTFTYVLGADYTTRSDIYLNIQFAHRYISGYTSDILYFKRNNYSLTGEISRDIFMDWLEASLLYSLTLNDNSWYLSPRITHTYFTNLDMVIGANLFSGDDDSWLGRFSDNDQLFIDISYRF
jgi:hypothetical protein